MTASTKVNLIVLATSVVILFGWPAGLYLFVKWLGCRKLGMTGQHWVSVWAAGWISLAIGLGALSLGAVNMLSDLFVLTYVSPLPWLIAFFMFRKWERENRQALKPDYGGPQEGVWPPPPNVPT